jgi:uncharacterized protein (TIGR03083 family)
VPVESALLATAYDGITRVVTGCTDADLARPTRCRGWTVADLLYHQLLDAQRALIALASPVDGVPDVDAVTYWAPHKPGAPWAADHERFIREVAAAYSSPWDVVRIWEVTSAAAARAAAAAPSDLVITTQQHRLTVDDLVSTLVVEAVVHHLDLTVELPDAPAPADEALAHVRAVFDAMLDGAAPAQWPTVDYVLGVTGRIDVPDEVLSSLGPAADRLPLLG